MTHSAVLAAAPWRVSALCAVVAFVAPAQAESAAGASLSFFVNASPGFAWVSDAVNVSSSSSDARAADFAGWSFTAGVFSPTFDTAASASDIAVGPAVPVSSASSAGPSTVASAFGFSDASQRVGSLSASALVPLSGESSATSFARSWFTLAPGASVTFQGGLVLSANGSNPALPANYSTGNFYGFAAGLLAVGNQLQEAELGGPAATGMPGSYALSSFSPLLLSFSNTGNSVLTTYLDSGVTAYSASVIPEPATVALWTAGLGLLAWRSRRQNART